MVVDDDDDMRFVTRTVINESNLDVEVTGVAADARDALLLWREDRPDVVVLDQRMPDRSGLDVARAILAEDPTQPIVIFSANLQPAVVEAAERLGVRECVQKDELQRLPAALERHGRHG